MAAELGQAVDIHGDVRHAFPGPGRLAGLEGFPGLFARKVENLRHWATRPPTAGSTGPGSAGCLANRPWPS